MNVLVVHPYRECIHQFYESHMFIPERSVQVATYLNREGIDVDFQDFGETTLEDENTFTIPLPDDLRGTGRTFTHYGWPKDEVDRWLRENLEEYDAVLLDSMMPYFNEGVEQIANVVDKKKIPLCFFGEWPALRPDDFQEHPAITGNYEVGCYDWVTSLERDNAHYNDGVHHFSHKDYVMDDLPAPDWHQFVDMENYPEPHRADYRASRGCPEDCDFCHVYGVHDRRFKFKDADTVIEDLQFLIDEGFTKIQLRDDNFNANFKNAERVFKWLGDNHPDIEILQVEGMEMKTAANAEDLIEQIGRCNYDSVRVGFETAIEGQFNKNALDWWDEAYDNFVNTAGFDPDEIICWALAGHPQLGRTDEIDTAVYLSQYGVRIIPSSYREVPGTELYNEGDPYLQGQMRPYDDDNIQRTKSLYRTVSHWNVFGFDIFRDEDFWDGVERLSWVERVDKEGPEVEIEGTVSGWTRTEAIEEGFALRLAMEGYHKSKLEVNEKGKMRIVGVKGNDEFNQMLVNRLNENDIETTQVGGLL